MSNHLPKRTTDPNRPPVTTVRALATTTGERSVPTTSGTVNVYKAAPQEPPQVVINSGQK